MSKADELILCIPREIIKNNRSTSMVLKAASSPIASIRRRGDVETDETLLQPIPYTVLIAPDPESDAADPEAKVLIYQRSSNGGEKRLEHQYSIGIGGHVNSTDLDVWFNDTDDTYANALDACLARELSEELGLPGGIECNVFLGPEVIYRDDEPVSRVHVGLNYFMILKDMPTLSVENALENVQWVSIEDVIPGGRYFDKLEGWSKEVGTNLRDMFEAVRNELVD